jgi:hypothetical protein
MLTDPMVSIFDNKFDSLNKSCGKSVMKSVSPNLLIFEINLFPVFLSNERFS